jgi:hypothetical protein
MSAVSPKAFGRQPRWMFLLQPRWLCWHGFAVVAVAGMFWLGDWQLHRALSGNELSWAYTFEWPLFAIFGVYFWARTIREELRLVADRDGGSADAAGPPAAASGAVDEERAKEDYMAQLKAEVRGHGRWHGLR